MKFTPEIEIPEGFIPPAFAQKVREPSSKKVERDIKGPKGPTGPKGPVGPRPRMPKKPKFLKDLKINPVLHETMPVRKASAYELRRILEAGLNDRGDPVEIAIDLLDMLNSEYSPPFTKMVLEFALIRANEARGDVLGQGGRV